MSFTLSTSPSLHFAASKASSKSAKAATSQPAPQVNPAKWQAAQKTIQELLKEEGPYPCGSIVIESRTTPGQIILLPEGQSIAFLDSGIGHFVLLDKDGKLLAAKASKYNKDPLPPKDFKDEVESLLNCLNSLGRRHSDNLRFLAGGGHHIYTSSWMDEFGLEMPKNWPPSSK